MAKASESLSPMAFMSYVRFVDEHDHGRLSEFRERLSTEVEVQSGTELGRAYSVAGQERFDQAGEVLPGLKKQWRRSGKRFSRPAHDVADGEVVGVDETFAVGGEALRFPRDPAASAKNTVNCGCASLPFMESWEVRHPGPKPFTPDELARDPAKRDLAPAREPGA